MGNILPRSCPRPGCSRRASTVHSPSVSRHGGPPRPCSGAGLSAAAGDRGVPVPHTRAVLHVDDVRPERTADGRGRGPGASFSPATPAWTSPVLDGSLYGQPMVATVGSRTASTAGPTCSPCHSQAVGEHSVDDSLEAVDCGTSDGDALAEPISGGVAGPDEPAQEPPWSGSGEEVNPIVLVPLSSRVTEVRA